MQQGSGLRNDGGTEGACRAHEEVSKPDIGTDRTPAFFIPDRFHSSAPEMILGIHLAFLVLGVLTVLFGHHLR
jgi:hypothetical protein